MNKFKIVVMIVTVLLVLTLVAEPIQAQDEPPTMPNLSEFTPRVDEDAFPIGPVVVDGGPSQKVMPISPVMEVVYTKTPKFYFLRDSGANYYQIEVINTDTLVKVYSFKGAGVCNAAYCYLQPTTKLKTMQYYAGGEYVWSVRARINGVWEPAFYPSYAPFIVISSGFTSTFDANLTKWDAVHGAWSLKNGSAKTDGITNTYASMFRRDVFYNYDLTAVMKRKNNTYNTSGVIVGGHPFPTYGSATWENGLYFQYNNNKNWFLYQYFQGNATSVASGTSSAIKPYDWNTLRIVVFYKYIDLWINDTYIGWLNYSGADFGIIGVDMFRSNLAKEPLLVDEVRLTSIVYPPMAEHDPAMQLGLEPVEEVDPNSVLVPTEMGDPTGTR